MLLVCIAKEINLIYELQSQKAAKANAILMIHAFASATKRLHSLTLCRAKK